MCVCCLPQGLQLRRELPWALQGKGKLPPLCWDSPAMRPAALCLPVLPGPKVGADSPCRGHNLLREASEPFPQLTAAAGLLLLIRTALSPGWEGLLAVAVALLVKTPLLLQARLWAVGRQPLLSR